MIAATVTLVVAGLILFLLGVRGRLASTAPHCRACTFDLSGLTGPDTCPECGVPLRRPRAIRRGRRARIRGLVGAGSIILVVGLVAAAGLTWASLGGFNLNRYKPTWLLMSEVGGRGTRASDAAAELNARDASGALSADQHDALLARALALHADVARPFPGPLTHVIGRAFYAGRLSQGEVRRYLSDLADPVGSDMSVNPPWVGDEIKVAIDHRWRAGKGLLGSLYNQAPLLSVHAGQWPDGPSFGGTIQIPQQPDTIDEIGPFRAPLEPGSGSIDLEITYAPRWDDMENAAASQGHTFDTSAYRDITVTKRIRVPVTVVPAGTGMPRLFQDDSLKDEILRSITRVQARLHGSRPEGSVFLSTGPAPVDLSFEVYWRAGGREWRVGIAAGAKGTIWGRNGGWHVDGFSGDHVDVVLRTNPMVIKDQRHKFSSVWDGEIVIPNVPVLSWEEAERQERPASGDPLK